MVVSLQHRYKSSQKPKARRCIVRVHLDDCVLIVLPSEELLVRFTGLVAALLSMWGYIEVTEQKTKTLFAISSVVWGVQYVLLGSATGAAIMVLAAVRQGVSVYAMHMSLRQKQLFAGVFTITAFVLTGLTAHIWYQSMVPLAATLIGTWSFFFCSNENIRRWTLLSNGMWAVHAVIFRSWELLACMIVLNVANLYGLYKISAARRLDPLSPSTH